MRDEPVWRRYLGFRGPNLQRDVDEEFEFHVLTRAAEHVAAGMSPGEARARAIEEFGDADGARRQCLEIGNREVRRRERAAWLEVFAQDLGYAWRSLARARGF